MTNPNRSQLYNLVANALADKPTQQPVHSNAQIGAVGKNDQKKANSKAGITVGYKAKQKGNPNKSYSVDVINKAVAKIA
jgi:hypothetical protein